MDDRWSILLVWTLEAARCPTPCRLVNKEELSYV